MRLLTRSRWLKNLLQRRPITVRNATHPLRARLVCEDLEQRTTPAVTAIQVDNINPTEGVAFGTPGAELKVGEFTINSFNFSPEPINYSAKVHWGDGVVTSGLGPPSTIRFQLGSDTGNGVAIYEVWSYHTYTDASAPGNPYVLTIDIFDFQAGGNTRSESGTIVVNDQPLGGATGAPVTAVVGAPLNNVLLGTFTDGNPFSTADDLTATITWGNPIRTTAGSIIKNAGGSYSVYGSHTYDASAPPTSGISVLVRSVTQTTVINTSATVTQAAVVPSAAPVAITEGATTIAAGTPVGSFTDTGGARPAAVYAATVQFPGAGGPTAVAVTQVGTTNVYTLVTAAATPLAPAAQTGTYNYTLSITPMNGAAASTLGQLLVNNAALSIATTNAPAPTEGEPLTNFNLMTFADANAASTGGYAATIDWGDGSPNSFGNIVQIGVGQFRVEGSHTYTDETPAGTFYRVTIRVTDLASGSVTGLTAPFVVLDNTLSNAVPSTVSGTDGVRLNEVFLGTFTDGNPFGRPSDFTVALNWGDSSGTDTVGTVRLVGGNQSSAIFAVYGSHTYAAAGNFTVAITVTDQGALAPLAFSTPATITAAQLAASANPITASEGVPTAAGLPVGTIYAPGAANAAALAVTFNWGDGGTSSTGGGTLTVSSLGGGSYSVTASPHTYVAFGTYVTNLSVVETGGGVASASNVAFVSNGTLTAAPGAGPFTAQEGLPFTSGAGNPLITFTDTNPAATAGQFTALIHWGDGTTSVGTVAATGPGAFRVTGSHTYLKDAAYTIFVEVEDNGGAKTGATVPFTATTATYTGAAIPISGVQNAPLTNVEVATFTSSNPFDTASRFYATINWNDGTPATAGIVVQDATANPPTFHVVGSHTYTTVGSFSPIITIAKGDPVVILVIGGGGGGGGGSITVSSSPLSANSVDVNGIEGVALPNAQNILTGTIVATFTDQGSTDPVTAYSATINWGNGQITTGTILQAGGNFVVLAPPAPDFIIYEDVGNYSFLVTITKSGGAFQSFAIGTAHIANAALTATNGGPFNVTEGQPLNANPLITFIDQDTTSVPGDFSVSINWGDGTPPVAGTLTQPGGPNTVYNVSGSHTYTKNGTYTVTVTVTDDAGKSIAGTAVVTAAQAAMTRGPATANSAVQNSPLVNAEVSSFTSANPFDVASQFAVSINWGDGSPTSSGTVQQDAGGTFHVFGTHTYASAGSFTITVEVAEGDPVIVIPAYTAGTVTVSATPLLVLPVNVNGTEGIVLPNAANAINGTVVATFLDLGVAAPLANYTAQIIWGNGQTTAGVVQQDGPNFIVLAPPTPNILYPNVGNYSVRVTVTKQTGAGSFVAFGIGTAHIGNAALAPVASAQVTGFQQTPLLNVEVGRFTDANPGALLSEYSAMIDWGDGTPMSAASFLQPGGAGTVVIVRGNHTYAHPSTPPAAPYAITVFVEDDDGGQVRLDNTAVIQQSVLAGTPVTINGVENQTFANVVVAYFADSATPGPVSSYSASINWGDGSPVSIGQIVLLGGNNFAVLGTKSYANAGNFPVTVVITRNGLTGVTVVSQAVIADAPINGTAVPFFAVEGANFTGTVAFFSSTNPADPATDFTALVTWGDGTTSTGTVVTNGTGFRVTAVDPGSGAGKRYQDEGQYTFSVRVTSIDGATFTAYEVATVMDAPLAATGITTTIPEWPAFTGIIATFTDANPYAQATTPEHVATINWGDGVTTTGTITQNFTAFPAPTSFTVTASHLYEPGVYQVTISIVDEGGSHTTALSTITVTDSPLTAGVPVTITSQEGQPFTAQVATFTDANPLGQIGEFSATINWGDGTPVSSAIIGQTAAGVFTVTGSHTYAAFTAAPLPVVVSIRSIDGATATVTSSANVTNAPLASEGANIVGIEGNSTGNVIVATFTDANPNSNISHFTTGGGLITISWGDGTPDTTVTAGNVTALGTANGVAYTVRSAHTYLNKGNYQLTVTIRDNGGATTVANGSAVIADAPLTRAGVQPTISGVEGTTFNGVVFTFIDGNPLSTTSDFIAEVNWGDGHIDAGVIAQPGGIGTPFTVSASHFFFDSGTYTIGVTVTDIDGSTIGYTATYIVTNVAPTAVISNNGPVNENSPATVTLSDPLDPSPVDKAAGFRYSFALTAGGLATSYLGASPSNSTQFVLPDGLVPPVGTTIFGRIFDKDGGFTDYTTSVTVLNVAPTATFSVATPLVPGQPSLVSFTNQFDPSPVDTAAGFTYSYDLGTGTFGPLTTSATATFTPPGPGVYVIRGRIFDKDGSVGNGSFTQYVALDPNGNPGIGVTVPNVDIFAAGAGVDGGPIVHVFSTNTYAHLYSFSAYEPTFRGGVIVATGDVTGDGIPDVITGTGNGGGPVVKVFAGPLFAEVGSFFAYESTFRGGVLVSTADVNGDGRAEIITGTGIGGGPVVKVFDGTTFAEMASFYAYNSSARGGVFVAGGNAIGAARTAAGIAVEEIITGAGAGGGPHVKVFTGAGAEVSSFFAYEPTVLSGVTVSAGDLYGTGYDNIVTGTGAGGGPNMRIWGPTGLPLFTSVAVFGPDKVTGEPLRNGFAVSANHVGGPNGRPIIIVGSGRDYGPTVRVFDGVTLDAIVEYVPFEKEFTGGVFVG